MLFKCRSCLHSKDDMHIYQDVGYGIIVKGIKCPAKTCQVCSCPTLVYKPNFLSDTSELGNRYIMSLV